MRGSGQIWRPQERTPDLPDRLIAATAISIGWRVATANVRHFRRMPGLDVVEAGPVP